MGYLLTPLALEDLEEISDYIAKDNPDSADKVLGDFVDAFEHLAEHPEMGHLRSDLTSEPFRFWPVHTYLVIYRSESKPIEILRILSGFRDLSMMLSNPAK